MDHPISLHLRSEVFMALLHHVGEGYYGDKTEAALCAVIRQWIATSDAVPDAMENADGENLSITKGYQWKQLFLPNGTELRATFQRHSVYAKVEDENIVCDGTATSPSRLVNVNGCGTRNAWRAIWLRFPGTARWELASRCRGGRLD